MKRSSLTAILLCSVSTLSAQVFFDDFDDGSRNTGIWQAPFVSDGAGGQLLEQNGRLEVITPEAEENGVRQQVAHYPRADRAWQLLFKAHVDWTAFSQVDEDATGSIAVEIGAAKPGNTWVEIGFGGGILEGVDFNQAVFSAGADPGGEVPEKIEFGNYATTVGIAVTYDPNRAVLRTYYNENPDDEMPSWILFRAFTLDGSNFPDATTLQWNMSDTDSFYVELAGHSETEGLGSGTVWADDFLLHIGPTANLQPGMIFTDNFNDDSRAPGWLEPEELYGSGEFEEINRRVEFSTDNASNDENEIQQLVADEFLVPYTDGFDVSVDIHSAPQGLTAEEQFAGGDLWIIGHHDVLLTVGAGFLDGASEQLIAASNSILEPEREANDELADKLMQGSLPEIVGLRAVWDPATKVLTLYTDTDGDTSTATWDLYLEYTLDGSTNGDALVSDWDMTDGDSFRVGIGGFSIDAPVQKGEVYFDNFSLTIESTPQLSGFELWASEISDESMRAPESDASGNGIPNVLQYLYGLPPMSPDTDVLPRIERNGDSIQIVHGINPDATDYRMSYEEKVQLSDPAWQPDAAVTFLDQFEQDGRTFQRIEIPTGFASGFYRIASVPN